jgi:general secretion pathway protein G
MTSHRNRRPRHRHANCRPLHRGFTLLEMMIVVGIIALLMGAGIGFMSGAFEMGQEVRVKADINTLSSSLQLYRTRNGNYPTTEQGLKALVPDIMESLPKDPWKNDYVYIFPGKKKPKSFDLYSKGANPQDANDDIGNWVTEGTTSPSAK